MKKVIVSLMLVLVVLALGACGQDGEQGVTKDKVVVGNAAATTGAFAEVGEPFNAAIQAYFSMINEEGGVAGREIEFKHYDDGFNSGQGQTYTQQLVEDDEVFALVGHFGTPTVGATYEYLNEIGIPRVYYATGISKLFEPNAEGGERASFPVQPIYDAEGEVMVARAVAELDAESIGVIYSNADDGKGMLDGIELRARALNIPLTTVQVASDATDMSTAAQLMLAANVDVIVVAANQEPAKTAIKALNDAGNTTPVITSYVNADATWLTSVSATLSSFDIYASSWVDAFANDSADLTLFAAEISKVNEAYAANAYAYAGWIAAATFVEGLERVGEDELTWENYIKAMEETPVELPFGVIVDYADNRRVGTQAMAFLKGTYDAETETAAFATEKPIQTISDILGE